MTKVVSYVTPSTSSHDDADHYMPLALAGQSLEGVLNSKGISRARTERAPRG